MFIKAVKYDLLFSRTVFFCMAALIIALAAILRQTASQAQATTTVYTEFTHTVIATGATGGGATILGMVMMFVAVISIFQVMAFFQKNLFEDTGYLMLTLPVSRFALLASKLVAAVVWLNFMLLAAAIAVIIVDPPPQTSFHFMGLSRDISFQNLVALVEVNVIAMSSILTIFFVIVLARCSVWKRHIGGAVAAGIGGLFAWGLFALHNTIGLRHLEQVREEMRFEFPKFDIYGEHIGTQVNYSTHTFQRSIVGINVGRIPIGDGYLDIYRFGVNIIICVLAFWAAHYLLEKRVKVY